MLVCEGSALSPSQGGAVSRHAGCSSQLCQDRVQPDAQRVPCDIGSRARFPGKNRDQEFELLEYRSELERRGAAPPRPKIGRDDVRLNVAVKATFQEFASERDVRQSDPVP